MMKELEIQKENHNEVLLPIKKKYSDRIFDGTKGYEFRKSVSKSIPKIIHVYESEGNKKIVGRLSVKSVLCGTPEEIWNKCCEFAGIDKEDFFNYFEGCDTAYAYVIEDTFRFARPRILDDYDLKFVPQGRVWVIKDGVRYRGKEDDDED